MHRRGFGVEVLSHFGRSVTPVIRGSDYYFPLPHRSEYKLRLTNDTSARADARVELDGKEVGLWRVPPGGHRNSITVERPVGIPQRFTFVAEESRIAERAGVEEGRSENGLLKVTFYAEREHRRAYSPRRERVVVEEPMYEMRAGSPSRGLRTEAKRSMSPPPMMSLATPTMAGAQMRSMSPPRASPMTAGMTFGAERRSLSPRRFESGATILGHESTQQFRDVDRITDVEYEVIFIARLIVETERRPVSPPRYQAVATVPQSLLSPRRQLSPRIPPRIDQNRW